MAWNHQSKVLNGLFTPTFSEVEPTEHCLEASIHRLLLIVQSIYIDNHVLNPPTPQSSDPLCLHNTNKPHLVCYIFIWRAEPVSEDLRPNFRSPQIPFDVKVQFVGPWYLAQLLKAHWSPAFHNCSYLQTFSATWRTWCPARDTMLSWILVTKSRMWWNFGPLIKRPAWKVDLPNIHIKDRRLFKGLVGGVVNADIFEWISCYVIVRQKNYCSSGQDTSLTGRWRRI